jgi:hypothetical protein
VVVQHGVLAEGVRRRKEIRIGGAESRLDGSFGCSVEGELVFAAAVRRLGHVKL